MSRLVRWFDRLFLVADSSPVEMIAGPERMAEARWRRNNELARLGPCHCGRPVEVLNREDHEVMGRVPREVWTCRGCVGATGWMNGRPLFSHPEPCPDGETLGCMSRMGAPSPYEYHCPHRTHTASEVS